MKNIYRYYKYNENITCAGLPTVDDLHKIKKECFEIVISLSMHTDSITLKDEDNILSNLGISYFHIPVDANKPKVKDFEMFLQLLQSFKSEKIFIHCTKNHRLSTFIYLYHFIMTNELKEKLLYQFCQPRKEWIEFIDIIINKYKRSNHETKNS